MDEYYTMRGINFSSRGLKFLYNRDISRNDYRSIDVSSKRGIDDGTSKHRDLDKFGTKDRVHVFFLDV